MNSITARAIYSKGVGGQKFWQKLQLTKTGHCIPQPLIDNYWQHTGWELYLTKDIDGKEVFEGDIVDVIDETGCILYPNVLIKFERKKMFAFVFEINDELYPILSFTNIGYRMKLKGNKHDLNF